ncbi:hypothetical protein CPB84DRAFT_1786891 [Gymnopilus junonius]|uniref:F-box domain-containing protein n=1 Tax=Gymnopilus junonius TaxID=109634 RepID=A0A9P5TKX6_GYMJU|nr:hypothetical protein CPB84DRAFT_1786891 [Gymnopilus junonius]
MSTIRDSLKESVSRKTRSSVIKTKRPRRHIPQPSKERPVSVAFPILPVELLLEILSYFPRPVDPLSTERWCTLFDDADASEYLAWRKTLLSLSQTCRHWREVFWTQLWRCIEVCEEMHTEEHGKLSKGHPYYVARNATIERRFNSELVRQLEVVTVRDPCLADYVKIINVEVVEFSIKKVLIELARCLSLFPNLRDIKLQILKTQQTEISLASIVRSVFSEHKYMQIRSVGVCNMSYPLLSSCPEARHVGWRLVSSNRSEHPLQYQLSGGIPCCPRVECLELYAYWTRNPEDNSLESIAEAFPNVRELTLRWKAFWIHSDLPDLDFLIKLLRLRKIEMLTLPNIKGDDRREFARTLVEHLLKLQKRDGEAKEAILHWATNKFPEKTILPAPPSK